MIKGWARGTGTFGAIVLASVLLSNTASAGPNCGIRLAVELTPDVPNPADAGFLSSLLSNQIDYRLSLRRERSDSLLILELTGPGPSYRCENAIEAIRRDGRVLSVRVRPVTTVTRADDSGHKRSTLWAETQIARCTHFRGDSDSDPIHQDKGSHCAW